MVLQNKKYNFINFISINFKIVPFYSIIKILNIILQGLLPAIQVLAISNFIDTAISIFNQQTSYQKIFLPLIFVGIAMILNFFCNFLNDILNLIITKILKEKITPEVISKRAKLKYYYIENNDTYDLIQRTCKGIVPKISGNFDRSLNLLKLTLSSISLILLIIKQAGFFGILPILFCVPILIIAQKMGEKIYTSYKETEMINRLQENYSSILENRDFIEERTMFSYTQNINQKWKQKFNQTKKIQLKIRIKNLLFNMFISVVFVGTFLCFFTFLKPLGQGTITIGIFIGLFNAFQDLISILGYQIANIVIGFSEDKKYLEDFTKFCALQECEAIDEPENLKDFELEEIEFKNVSFKYPDTEREILKNCSFKLKKGIHYAFVGLNGAGKTTITKLLTGMFDNYTGEIFINGKNLKDYSFSKLKSIFAIVYQDFAKYSISLKENVMLGNVNEINEEKMKEVIKEIGLEKDILNLANGYETNLGKAKEDGIDLSGGQWQKIAIARALYSDAKMYILDEPTSALDPIAESQIYEIFDKISEGKSTIFITHRLGAAKLADEIIVINEGRVFEKGSHNELMIKNGIYKQMFESQKGWYDEKGN